VQVRVLGTGQLQHAQALLAAGQRLRPMRRHCIGKQVHRGAIKHPGHSPGGTDMRPVNRIKGAAEEN
jgi:hypothetical protein